MARSIEAELADLAMVKARFEVRLATADGDGQWTERGLDQVEFFLSANLGEEPRPLARIVSGGELSRVMLALKTLSAATVADQGATRTLIFDEVDAGIGGRVATVVGEKLASLGQRYRCSASPISPRSPLAAAPTSSSRRRPAAVVRSPAS